jgi:dihydrodipicolinate synthase/N-acetylneuraminate lyase
MRIGHPGLLIATPRTSDAIVVARALDEISRACRAGDIETALAAVDRLVPEFHNADRRKPFAQPHAGEAEAHAEGVEL